MQVAVSCMKDICHRTTVFFGYLPDSLKHLRQFGPQYATIVDQIIRREIADCPEGTTPRLARRVGGCRISHPDDREAIRQAVVDYYESWERGESNPIPDGDALRFYDRAHQADRFLRFLRDVTPEC